LYQILQPKRERTETATRTGALLVPDANLPSGGKRGQAEGSGKSGGQAINLEQMLPWRGAEENILRNSGTWGGWRNPRGLSNQFPGTKNRCGGNK